MLLSLKYTYSVNFLPEALTLLKTKLVKLADSLSNVKLSPQEVKLKEIEGLIDDFIKYQTDFLSAKGWRGIVEKDGSNYALQHVLIKFIPPEFNVLVVGDIHGTITSLDKDLEDMASPDKGFLKKAGDTYQVNNGNYLLFLGDNADRGENGIDVWTKLLKLKLKNPDNVFLLRGNHETGVIAMMYGFLGEWNTTFKDCKEKDTVWGKMMNLFGYLSNALFLITRTGLPGTYNCVQCCHGGIGSAGRKAVSKEGSFPREEPKEFFDLSELSKFCGELNIGDQKTFVKVVELPKEYIETGGSVVPVNGFFWGDFCDVSVKGRAIVPNERPFFSASYDEWKFRANVLSSSDNGRVKMCGMIRGHQHHKDGVQKDGVLFDIDEFYNLTPEEAPVFTVMSSDFFYYGEYAYSNAYVQLRVGLLGKNKGQWLIKRYLIGH
jgi:hypothetical protein